ncbi:amidohydrolase [Micromonospora sonchi]|uniref:Amidohydrolase n=1 Tax=Micromonospora sonchi TaxID=1763543 RepID=A0A917UA69_9ACTN|nr:amidohydrolase [Micromonospora sonchi]
MRERLVLRGGLVLDPVAEVFRPGEVHLAGDRVVAGDVDGPARVVDVTGLLVTPGLVDLHTHVFAGQDLGVDADTIGAGSGVTTFVDAGSAGGHLIDAFRMTSVAGRRSRVRVWLNIASIGTTSIRLAGELTTLAYCDERVAVEAARRHRDLVIGVKIRASHDVGGPHGPVAMARARRVADELGLPLMVHLGPAPCPVDDIMAALRAGDVLTHCCTGFAGNEIVAGGRLRASVRAARDRGVRLDVGHGMSGFDVRVARAMLAEGVLPDSISSDLHAYSQPLVGTLPDVLSRFLALGMNEAQAFARATLAPAAIAGLADTGVGTLRAGAPADVAVFRLVDMPDGIDWRDGHGNNFRGRIRLEPVLTVASGIVVLDRTAGAG